jgi:guanosine-diphosphatase
MRILSKDAQTAILNEVSRIFKTLPYLFDSANPQWCQVIDGQLEGAFMWLTVNYALGKIKKTIESQLEMVSIIDLGGASTQITYVPPLATLAADKNLEIVLQNYNNYNLFSTSFLGWGNDMIRNNIIENYSVKWTD